MARDKFIKDITKKVVVVWDEEPLEFEVRTEISWNTRNNIIKRAVTFTGGKMAFDYATMMDALWDAFVVKSPFTAADKMRMSAELGAQIEKEVLLPMVDAITAGLSKDDTKN